LTGAGTIEIKNKLKKSTLHAQVLSGLVEEK
jgi:hypothetical protein